MVRLVQSVLVLALAVSCNAFRDMILSVTLVPFNDTQTYTAGGILGHEIKNGIQTYGIPQRIGAAVVSMGNGMALFTGGKDVTDSGVYQTVTSFSGPNQQSTQVRGMLSPRYSHGITRKGNTVYVCGGNTGNVLLNKCETYDGNQWAVLGGVLPRGVSETGLSNTPSGILSVGGNTVEGTTNAVYEYDMGSSSWQNRAPLPAPLRAFGIAQYPGQQQTIVCGGCLGTNGFMTTPSMTAKATQYCNPQSACYSYDPSGAGKWTSIAALQLPRAYFTMVPYNGVIYAIGGRIIPGTNIEATTNVEVLTCLSATDCYWATLETGLSTAVQQAATVAVV